MIEADERLVIVVGAGASAEFGIPTGQKLVADLRHGQIMRPSADRYNIFEDTFDNFYEFVRKVKTNSLQTLNKFIHAAQASPHNSIDLFAFHHPSFSDICKYYSAWGILKGHYRKANDADAGSNWQIRTDKWLLPNTTDGNQNWLGVLVLKYLEGSRKSNQLRPETLTFVTFNYDRIIENAFRQFITQTEMFNDADEASIPKTLHVYGSFPELPKEINNTDIFEAAANAISYINDEKKPADTIDEIRAKVREATTIFFVGFDFDPLNVEYIALNESAARKFALAYDGNDRLVARMRKLNISTDHIKAGSFDNPISIGLAASRGFFDMANLID
ncbi:MAG: hypothetical protein R3C60_07160 [Parvularculaceae bacterium]